MRCRRRGPDGGPPRAGRAGRPGRRAVGDPRWRAGRGRRGGPGGRRRAGAAACGQRRAGPAAFLAFDLLAPRRSVAAVAAAGPRREALRRVLRPGRRGGRGAGHRDGGRSRCSRRPSRRASPGSLPGSGSSPYLPGVRSRLWRFVAARRGRGRAGADGRVRPDAPDRRPAPVLALISRLPLDDEYRRALALGSGPPRRRHEGPHPRPLPVEQDAGGIHPGRHDGDDRDRRDSRTRSTAATSHGWTGRDHQPRQHHERAERRHERGDRRPTSRRRRRARRSRSGSRPSPPGSAAATASGGRRAG